MQFSIDVAVAGLAAVAASGFAADLGRSHLRRPRPHALAWSVAMTGFALATWSLVIGLAAGWNEPVFLAFYWLGAIVNIPLLAAGSVYLVLGNRAGRRFAIGVMVFVAAGGLAVLLAEPETALSGVQIPEGSEVFTFTIEAGGISLPGPRLFAAFAGGIGTIVIVGLAVYSSVRGTRRGKRLIGNALIVLGTSAPAVGGSFTALGESAGFATSLLVGAALLWAGYRVASGVGGNAAAVPRPSGRS